MYADLVPDVMTTVLLSANILACDTAWYSHERPEYGFIANFAELHVGSRPFLGRFDLSTQRIVKP